MGLFLLSVFIVFLSSSHQLLCAARSRLAAGESISVNQTIISAGQIFALGFFTPSNSTPNLYAGIWYNRVPGRTVVWVANRENPLKDPAGVLTISRDGNIAVKDGAGSVVWSTNLPRVPRNTSAVLLDSGNLVLRHGQDDDVWQSFEHPTDTLLPGMKMRSNFSGGTSTRLTSWRDATDPSPGEFVFTIDPQSSLQPYIMKGSEIYWRGSPWNGSSPLTALMLGNLSSFYVETVHANGLGIYSSFAMTGGSLARYVLDHSGRYTFYLWDNGLKRWNSTGSVPTRPCDVYNRCGSFGSCDASGSSPLSLCKCLDAFKPRNQQDWEKGNFTGGCVRLLRPQCDGTDRFVGFGGMKLPDHFSTKWNMTAAQCEAECSANCGCKAYAHLNLSSSNITSSRCLVWAGELMDLVQMPLLSGGFYVRLSSKPDNNTLRDDGSSSKRNKGWIKIVLPILSGGMLLMGICSYFFIRRFKSKVGTRRLLLLEDLNFSDTLGNEKDITDVPLLDFNSLKAATANFSSVNKLGQGGFGPVYKGELLNGHEIAVKRLSKGSKQGQQEFANEVILIAKLQHKNLVRLLGWCSHKDEKILIYEFMPNGSLDRFIFDATRSRELNWDKRFKIIEGIANGVLYLHQYSRMRIIHRDLKTSNILLDGEMTPKISDFGLARIFGINQIEANTGKVVGTYGYMSPEYALNGIFSEKSDVFSFGVILLEIITGKRSTGFFPHNNSRNLLAFVWHMWEEGRASELQDPSMGSSSQATEVRRCTQLGLLCIQEDPAERPTMSSVVSFLSNETCTLPIPKHPAFAIGRNPNPILPLPHDTASKSSIDDITMSTIEGR